ncbi:hypothetical protein PR003_g31709, partial [Phytophthora rubi]
MACLWAGNRRWKSTRKAYKKQLGAAKNDKGRALSTARQQKWAALSPAAATGLGSLTWKRIRRIVGLNPWGEQLLVRVKLHAISVFNPVTAGLGCPHTECERVGRVDLYHVFWECAAARRLREILICRWKVAGLRLESYEEAVLALALPEMPAKLARVTGKIVAAGSDAQTASIGDAVERMVANCWSIGAATYLLAVWRWRVAHFDALNDVSAAYHTAGLRTRLHYGHMDATRDYAATVPSGIGHRLSEAICGVLGASWEEAVNMPLGFTHAYLIAVAGSRDGKSLKCSSGILIAQIHKNTGNYRIKQVGSKRFRSQHWELVHILGDHPDALRQH